MDADYAKRTARIKDLLSSYYGTGEDAGPAGSGGAGSVSQSDNGSAHGAAHASANIESMDSVAYNSDKHAAQILKTYSLEKLMQVHRSTAREIKNLDSDMQQLVYENYNKFIAATDTIRTMKTNVDTMGSDMDKLKVIMDAVTEKSHTVNQKLARRRDDIEQLHKVQTLLKKLQAVFDLPKRMRAALAEDALASAVSFYAEARPLLRKFGHRGSFKSIAAEADAVARDISAALKKQLTDKRQQTDTEQCVLLLRKLGEADDTLQDKYMQGRMQRMRRILQEAAVVVDAMALAAAGEPVPEGLSAALEAPSSWGFTEPGSPPPLATFIKALDERFINALRETVINVTTIFLQEDNKSATKRRPLVSVAREVCGEYITLIKRALADAAASGVLRASRLTEGAAVAGFDTSATDGGGSSSNSGAATAASCSLQFQADWGAEAVSQALSQATTDLGLLNSQLPELSLKDRGREISEKAVRHHVLLSFRAVEMRVQQAVQLTQRRINDTGSSSTAAGGGGGGGSVAAEQARVALLQPAFSYCLQVLQRAVASVMQGLRVYEGPSAKHISPWRDAFVDLVQGQLQGLFLQLLASFVEITRVKYEGCEQLREPARAALTTAAFADVSPALQRRWQRAGSSAGSGGAAAAGAGDSKDAAAVAASQDAVHPGLVMLLAKLCMHMETTEVPNIMDIIATSFTGGGGGAGGGDEPPAFVAGEVARRLGTAAAALLSAYVELHGRQLSLMVRRSVAATNWLVHNEARAPRPLCDLMIDRLGKAEAEVRELVEGGGATASSGGSSSSKAGRPSARGPDHQRGASHASSDWDPSLALESGNVERNMAKLFRGKVKIFGNVRFTQPHLLAAVAGAGLKSWVECIRLQTLGRAGLQQLQLDIHYLRPLLRKYVGPPGGSSSNLVDLLLDEVVSAGVERSTDPSLLEAGVLDRILTMHEQDKQG